MTPYLREAAKAGHQTALANFGSLGSWESSAAVAHCMWFLKDVALCRIYTYTPCHTDCSTKFAVSGLTVGLAEELKPFGISVCSVEPGYTRTGFLANSGAGGSKDGHRVKTARTLDVYDGTPAAAVRGAMEAYNQKQPNDVVKSARVIVDVLTRSGVAEGRGEIPVRLVLGRDCLETARKMCEESLRVLGEWADVSESVGYDD